MGASLAKMCCCGREDQQRQQGVKSALLASSLAPSRGSSPSLTEPFFSANSSPEHPPVILHPRAFLALAPLPLILASTSPLAVLIPNFLTLDECQSLITLAQAHLRPSKICGMGVCPGDRCSDSMFINGPGWTAHFPEVASFELKAASLASAAAAALGRAPVVPVEAPQIVRYTAGQFYAQHHDNDTTAGTKRLQRALTLIVYLCDVEKGGETAFPLGRAAAGAATVAGAVAPWGGDSGGQHGFDVHPRAGQALIFWSALPQASGGGPDLAAVHAAATVEAGEKWIATRWFKEVEEEEEGESHVVDLGCSGGVIE